MNKVSQVDRRKELGYSKSILQLSQAKSKWN